LKKTAIVICPGRGTYNAPELGYLARHHADSTSFIDQMDRYRVSTKQTPISELDSAERYRPALHLPGDNASALIYTCALADYAAIDREAYDIVAVTGNSMGWYLALAAGGAVSLDKGMHIVNSMGTLMHKEACGGQVIFPICDDNWQYSPELNNTLSNVVEDLNRRPDINISTSIRLGGMVVLAANDQGVKALLGALPKTQDRYPFALPMHGGFHSQMMAPISTTAMTTLLPDMFSPPDIPLIDGRGHIWQPHSTDLEALHRYTFSNQVCEPYDYSAAVEVACKEFAPDCLIILGPGTTLGPVTAQQLINMTWQGLTDKTEFKKRQQNTPFILSMGIDEQRQCVVAPEAATL